jgi:hypothetical protein
VSEPKGELRDDDEPREFQCGGDSAFAEHGDVVLIGVADLFKKPMGSELL